MNNKKLQNGINLFNSLAVPMSSEGINTFLNKNKNPEQAKEIGNQLKKTLGLENILITK